MKKIILLLIIGSIFINVKAQSVHVAAAANLRYVLEEIKGSYQKKYPSATVNLSFGSSGTLTQQILNGASYDLFLSADNVYPHKIAEKKLAAGPVSMYAFGKLALYSSTINVSKGLKVLTDPTVKRIAIANPETAPYGKRSVEILEKQALYKIIKSKIIWGENIAQTIQFASTGNAEVGLVALSLLKTPEISGKGYVFVIPDSMYLPIEQSGVLLKQASENSEAARFMNYILSAQSKPIWEKYGYSVPAK